MNLSGWLKPWGHSRGISRGPEVLQEVLKGSRVVPEGLRGLRGVLCGFKWLQGVSEGSRETQGCYRCVSGDLRKFQRTSGAF